MAWSQIDLDRLDTAISSGIRSVTFADGRRTEYQNLAEMQAVRKAMKAELAAASSQARPRNRFIVGRVGRR